MRIQIDTHSGTPKRLLSLVGSNLRECPNHNEAERLVQEGLRAKGWTEKQLPLLPKGDREKVKLALRLRTETTMTLHWIAKRLHMGS